MVIMETPIKNKSGDNTGVSRSGRVRKKSSKLADFESPDEIDTRFKRKTDRPQKTQKSIKIGQSVGSDIFDDSDSYIDDEIEVKDEPLEVEDWGDNDDGDDDICDDGDDRDEGNDPLHVDDDSTDMPRETPNYSQAQSLYFSEKQGKKNIMLKDGQVVRRKKAQRKDKGMYNDPELQEPHGHAATADPVVMSGTPTVASQKDIIPASLPAQVASSFTTGTSNRHVPDPRPTQSASSNRRTEKRVCDETDSVLQEALHQLRELSSSTEDSNAQTAFARVVVNDLSQMCDENKIYAQKLISDILFLGKLGKLSSSTKIIE